ncbi:MAG: S-layer homology domain-containing protein [Bacillota bacterium]
MKRGWMGWSARLLLALLAVTALAGLPGGAAAAETTVKVTVHPQFGPILTDGAGLTLYYFTKDSEGKSVCYDACQVNWPPLLIGAGQSPVGAEGLPGTLGTTVRKDGRLQVTYNGFPLYYWIADAAPGETLGHGVNNVWYVVSVGLFADTHSHWAGGDVARAVQAGWVSGYPGGSFRPDGQVTRAEFLKMLTGALGLQSSEAPPSFADTAGHWAAAVIEGAVSAGVVVAAEYPGGSFEPDRAITREEIALFVARAAGLVREASEAGLERFTDQEQVSPGARTALAAAAEAGILTGYPDQTIRPRATATRAEAVVMIQRAADLESAR